MRDVVLTHPKFRGNIRQFVHATKPLLRALPENFLHVIEFNVGSLLAVVGKPQFVVSNNSMQGRGVSGGGAGGAAAPPIFWTWAWPPLARCAFLETKNVRKFPKLIEDL